MNEGLLPILWLVGPVIFGLYARTPSARIRFPKLVRRFYSYCLFHAIFFTFATIFSAIPSILSGRIDPSAILIVFPLLVLSAASAWYYWGFDNYRADDPAWVPFGVRLWAYFSPEALASRKGTLVDLDAVTDRVSETGKAMRDTAHAKAETQRAKLNAYELRVAQEHEEAKAELAKAAREYNEAKLRAEEAERRRKKHDRS